MLVRLFTDSRPDGYVTRVYEVPNWFDYPDLIHYETIGEDIMM